MSNLHVLLTVRTARFKPFVLFPSANYHRKCSFSSVHELSSSLTYFSYVYHNTSESQNFCCTTCTGFEHRGIHTEGQTCNHYKPVHIYVIRPCCILCYRLYGRTILPSHMYYLRYHGNDLRLHHREG